LLAVCELSVLSASAEWSEDASASDDDDRQSEGRYDRRQNTRDVNDLQMSLRQRLNSSQFVLISLCVPFVCSCCYVCKFFCKHRVD